jgi:hypothetical protein
MTAREEYVVAKLIVVVLAVMMLVSCGSTLDEVRKRADSREPAATAEAPEPQPAPEYDPVANIERMGEWRARGVLWMDYQTDTYRSTTKDEFLSVGIMLKETAAARNEADVATATIYGPTTLQGLPAQATVAIIRTQDGLDAFKSEYPDARDKAEEEFTNGDGVWLLSYRGE